MVIYTVMYNQAYSSKEDKQTPGHVQCTIHNTVWKNNSVSVCVCVCVCVCVLIAQSDSLQL